MGYKSDVALVIRKTYERAMLADPDVAQILSEADQRLEHGDALLFHWSWVTWYHDDKQIAALENFLRGSESDGYLFIRVGEDDNDTEIFGWWFDNPLDLEYVRRIEFADPSASRLQQAHVAGLKSLNTRPEAKTCAQCGTALNDPIPGMPSMKHCPACEP